ncbi:MAG: prepilin-type N-terminal cleavage/methylation domain-containing protein [Phycisphaerales bacterium]
MVHAHHTKRAAAFTLIELIAVVLILSLLAGVAVPQYFDHAANARTAALQGTLGNVRSACGNFYANSSLNGTARYPTLAELSGAGVVIADAFPAMPFNAQRTVAAATATEFSGRSVSGTVGWRYYVDNALAVPACGFYANSTAATTVVSAGGAASGSACGGTAATTLTANQL